MEYCKFGCGQEGKFQNKDGSWMCSNSANKCPTNIKKQKTYKKIESENIDKILCKYGCEQIGKYKFNYGWCCSSHSSRCPSIISKKIGQKRSDESRLKMSISSTGIFHSNETKVKMSKSQSGKMINVETKKKLSKKQIGKCASNFYKNNIFLTLDVIKVKYPNFYQSEDLKEDIFSGRLMGRCKYSGCKNSKENNGWFILTSNQWWARRDSVEYGDGNHSYFYCSDRCKGMCNLFNLRTDPFYTPPEFPWTEQELSTWSKKVLFNQFQNYGQNFCVECNSINELKVHHKIPKKVDWFQALDPPNGIILCKYCHDEKHKAGTIWSYGNLAFMKRC